MTKSTSSCSESLPRQDRDLRRAKRSLHLLRLYITVILVTALAAGSSAQVLFTYNRQSVDAREFLEAFERNNNGYTDRRQALTEYLELYIRYRLKVQAAMDLRLDTLPQVRQDLAVFRQQLLPAYLSDPRGLDSLCEEAYRRAQIDIRLGHIFIPADFNRAADTLRARQQIDSAWQQLRSGKNFRETAMRWSREEGLDQHRGVPGWITVFSLSYPIENIVYTLPLGSHSAPYRSSKGYHIFARLEDRPAAGIYTVAQVLLSPAPDADEQDWQAVRRQADSIYSAIRQGMGFEAAARNFSMDIQTASKGGVLPPFGVGVFMPEFEEQAFALSRDGEVGKPFRTSTGYHILQRIRRESPFSDTLSIRTYYRDRVLQDPRGNLPRQWFENRILERVKLTRRLTDTAALWKLTDTLLFTQKLGKGRVTDQSELFVFPKSLVRVSDWLRYVPSQFPNPASRTHQAYADVMARFERAAILGYYRDHLEDYNPAFQQQLDEFRNGSILFEAMERSVWNPAQQDTAGLRKFYQAQAGKYRWQPGAEVIIFSAADSLTAITTRNSAAALAASWRNVPESLAASLVMDSTRMEWASLGMHTPASPKAGTLTPLQRNEGDGSWYFAYILRTYSQAEPRSFEDARVMALADFQNQLEENWITDLRKRYGVKVNDKTWKEVLTTSPPSPRSR